MESQRDFHVENPNLLSNPLRGSPFSVYKFCIKSKRENLKREFTVRLAERDRDDFSRLLLRLLLDQESEGAELELMSPNSCKMESTTLVA